MTTDFEYALDPVGWCIDVLGITPDEWQGNALRSPAKRILMNCSRQSGKSTTAGIIVLHRCVFYPGSLTLVVSPSLRQSGELFRLITGLLQRVPNQTMTEDNKTSFTLSNGSRCVSLPGTEQTVRGFGGVDLVVIDEMARVSDELIISLSPMIATSGGRLIGLSTPYGKRGYFWQEWTTAGEDWYRFQIPACECPRISKEFLDGERRSLGLWAFNQEYLCEFGDTENSVFSYDTIMAALSDTITPLFSECIEDPDGGTP
jgi:hypothetical protein